MSRKEWMFTSNSISKDRIFTNRIEDTTNGMEDMIINWLVVEPLGANQHMKPLSAPHLERKCKYVHRMHYSTVHHNTLLTLHCIMLHFIAFALHEIYITVNLHCFTIHMYISIQF